MRIRVAAAVVALLALASIVYSEYRKAEVATTGAPIAYLIGDSEQELSRLPMTATRISDEEEFSIGNALASQYVDAFASGKKNDPEYQEAQKYIEQVGNSMVGFTHRKLPYKFHYIPDPFFVNAFALPGGHVFIGQGLINLMDSEDQLASVLGHEMEHADLGHCVERVQIEARLRHFRLGDLGELIGIPYSIFEAGYSKEQELAADANGTQLAVDAHYSPMGAVRLFQTFAKYEPGAAKPGSPQEELASVAVSGLSEYFRSHPRSADRAQEIERLITTNHWPVPAERELKIAYIGLNREAEAALSRFEYNRALAFAQRSLKIRPHQDSPRNVIYQAALYTGDFATAANTAEEQWVEQPGSMEKERKLAAALAAMKASNSAISRFQKAAALTRHEPRDQSMIAIDLAGLQLIAGDERPIKDALAQTRASGQSSDATRWNPPNVIGTQMTRIGRWYYLAGRYEDAYNILTEAQELVPQSDEQRRTLAWSALQTNKFSTATGYFQGESFPDSQVGNAIISWRLERQDSAIQLYSEVASDPRWSNEAWVSAFYGPSAYRTLRDIAAEIERRKHKNAH